MSALVGKAGEALVAAELLRRGANIAYPAYDGGIDLLAYRELDFSRVVPIQVKARSLSCYNFQKSWFRIKGLVLVQVWHVSEEPQFYVFSNLQEVEEALGTIHSISPSWTANGGYNVTEPGDEIYVRMKPHRDRWDRVLSQLQIGSPVS
jgi:hypothetical protein